MEAEIGCVGFLLAGAAAIGVLTWLTWSFYRNGDKWAAAAVAVIIAIILAVPSFINA